jgi:hypothetical protein
LVNQVEKGSISLHDWCFGANAKIQPAKRMATLIYSHSKAVHNGVVMPG